MTTSRANPKAKYLPLLEKAISYQLKREEAGSVCRMTADTPDKVFTLPDATTDPPIGAIFEFERLNYNFTVDTLGADRIGFRGTTNLAAALATVGDRIQVCCTVSGIWEVITCEGSPTVDGIPLANAASTSLAIFSDVRVSTTPGGPGTTGKWMARMLTDDTELNTSGSNITLQKFEIIGVNVGTKTFTVDGDQTPHLEVGHYLSVRGSTGNDREGIGTGATPYIIDTVTFDTDHTDIVVLEVPASAVADGYIFTGRIVLKSGTYEVDVVAENCGSQGSACRIAQNTDMGYTNGYVDSEGIGVVISQQGSASNSPNGATTNSHSHLHTTFQTQSATEYWEVQQYVWDDDTASNNLLGMPASTSIDEHYCRISLRRIGEGSLPS